MRAPALTAAALLIAILLTAAGLARAAAATPPYPPSDLIAGVVWDQGSYRSGGRGGDIWPVTTAADGRVFTAWGDGVVGCPARVSFGVATLASGPGTLLRTTGCGPAGGHQGKITALLGLGSTLYAIVNLQDWRWPRASAAVWRSGNGGRAWNRPLWRFAGSDLRPGSFVNFGPGYAGARDGYVYLTAIRPQGVQTAFFLMRAAPDRLQDKAAYAYYAGSDLLGRPSWAATPARAVAVFVDPAGIDGQGIVHDPALGRYLLTVAHGHAGQLGLFEGTAPWGPWRTVSYEESWLGITGGEFLGLGFPAAWTGAGGWGLWAVFSCYGLPGCGPFHDRFNLIHATLTPVTPAGTGGRGR